MAELRGSSISIPEVKIQDVPDAPTASATDVGTSRAYNNGAATVTVTNAATGGRPSSYTVTSTPGSITATGTSPLTVTGLSSATSYTFTATATNSTATGPASAASNSITATTVPQAPTIGTASVTNATTVSIPFTAGATGGSSITSYTTTSSPSISLTTTGTTTPLSVTGTFAANQAYTFTIAANNANGASSASSASNSITPLSTAFDSIATTTLGSDSSTVLFDSIPGTYQHLQIRIFAKNSNNGLFGTSLDVRCNGVTTSLYNMHQLLGNGSAASATNIATTSIRFLDSLGESSNASIFGVCIIDIHDYASTTKNKTFRSFMGWDTNGSGKVSLNSGLFRSTNAITSITLGAGNFGEGFRSGSTFALYGIKGA